MKFIFCVSLSAIVIISGCVLADKEQELFNRLRNTECIEKTQQCQKVIFTKADDDDLIGLCNAKPLPTTATKCMMDCQMRQYEWLDNNGEFQEDKYLAFIEQTSLGYDQSYVEAAANAASICKYKKSPIEDSCDTAYIILKCLQDEGDKHGRINIGYGLFYVNPFFFEFENV